MTLLTDVKSWPDALAMIAAHDSTLRAVTIVPTFFSNGHGRLGVTLELHPDANIDVVPAHKVILTRQVWQSVQKENLFFGDKHPEWEEVDMNDVEYFLAAGRVPGDVTRVTIYRENFRPGSLARLLDRIRLNLLGVGWIARFDQSYEPAA